MKTRWDENNMFSVDWTNSIVLYHFVLGLELSKKNTGSSWHSSLHDYLAMITKYCVVRGRIFGDYNRNWNAVFAMLITWVDWHSRLMRKKTQQRKTTERLTSNSEAHSQHLCVSNTPKWRDTESPYLSKPCYYCVAVWYSAPHGSTLYVRRIEKQPSRANEL